MQTIYPNVQVHSHLSINGQSVTNANTNLNNHHHNDAAAAMMFASTQHRTPNDLNSSPTSSSAVLPFLSIEPPLSEDDYNFALEASEGIADLFDDELGF